MKIEVGKTYYGKDQKIWRKVLRVDNNYTRWSREVTYTTNIRKGEKSCCIGTFTEWAKREGKQSNADKIRAMSDEELATALDKFVNKCGFHFSADFIGPEMKDILKWLKEAEQ